MNNPFFVLTSSENEIIGVIHNPTLPHTERARAIIIETIIDKVQKAMESHYDRDCPKSPITESLLDDYRPIEFKLTIGDDEQDMFDETFTLTPAWDY